LGLAEFVAGDGWVVIKVFLKNTEKLKLIQALPHAKDAKDATEIDRRLRR